MTQQKIYDVIGIGIGPFNLGLAALLDRVDDIEALFFEQEKAFDWHPGMLIEGADMQTSFLSDLVTLADPTSPYTFLNYLHHHNRLYQFINFHRFKIPRTEYNDYAKWVASQLDDCHFGKQVVDLIEHSDASEPYYEVVVSSEAGETATETKETEHYYSRHVVLGTGGIPNILPGFEAYDKDVFHTSQYMFHKDALGQAKSITIVGSGQSAAEVFYDLLQDQERFGYELALLTQAPGIFQLEQGKVAQEAFSPDYIKYFHSLPFDTRMETLPTLNPLRKGVDPHTLADLYDLLYERSVSREDPPIKIQPVAEVRGIKPVNENQGGPQRTYLLTCHQYQEDQSFTHQTEKVILATGYQFFIPDFMKKFSDQIVWEDEHRYKVSLDYKIEFKDKDKRANHIFTVSNLEHSHGAGATNLRLSVQRNQRIINSIAGREVYPVPENTVFQQFSMKNNH
ncbi:lysine N(6)-hydroxylase/L-ornithine N(5)-oxygenase family protein [Caldalkalibacillus salinus]|uniref:lysine N(6)-hydroxylase/L-ornithine N(5)-oxygenase family protein n=1 Tax=Caldalkalibacillus salinus TaxID=2803787 RepID=UPI003017EB0D